MPLLRWLLPLIAALALLSSTVAAWASAGIVGGDDCCCPVKTTCKCHDHDDRAPSAPELKRCGERVERVAPTLLVAIEPASPEIHVTERRETAAPPALEPMPDDLPTPPEPPPF
ncbi:MAG: hypothetical protein M3680_14810 [Myxococcota bacterium]|nr:hypothetical protein [Myxococcota bacterium]